MTKERYRLITSDFRYQQQFVQTVDRLTRLENESPRKRKATLRLGKLKKRNSKKWDRNASLVEDFDAQRYQEGAYRLSLPASEKSIVLRASSDLQPTGLAEYQKTSTCFKIEFLRTYELANLGRILYDSWLQSW